MLIFYSKLLVYQRVIMTSTKQNDAWWVYENQGIDSPLTATK